MLESPKDPRVVDVAIVGPFRRRGRQTKEREVVEMLSVPGEVGEVRSLADVAQRVVAGHDAVELLAPIRPAAAGARRQRQADRNRYDACVVETGSIAQSVKERSVRHRFPVDVS